MLSLGGRFSFSVYYSQWELSHLPLKQLKTQKVGGGAGASCTALAKFQRGNSSPSTGLGCPKCSVEVAHQPSPEAATPSGLPFLFGFVLFLGPHLQHTEVPRLGAESELQLLA